MFAQALREATQFMAAQWTEILSSMVQTLYLQRMAKLLQSAIYKRGFLLTNLLLHMHTW